jgi:hypothetical protein
LKLLKGLDEFGIYDPSRQDIRNPNDDDAMMGAQREAANVGKVQICCDQSRPLSLSVLEHAVIVSTPQTHISHILRPIADLS